MTLATKTVGVDQVLQHLEALESLGLPPRDRLCRGAGLEPALLAQPQGRLPRQVISRLYAEAERLSGDPLIGLRAGACSRARGLLGHLFLAGRTVAEGLSEIAPLGRVASDSLYFEFVRDVSVGWLRFGTETSDPTVLPLIEEYLGALIVQSLVGSVPGFRAVEVHFVHAPRGAAADYEAVLGGPVRFRQAHNAIGISSRDLALRIPTANPLVARLVADELGRQLELTEGSTFRMRVQRALVYLIDQGQVGSCEEVARRLGVGARTLQRRLHGDGTTFRSARDEVLREAALELLGNTSLPVQSVAEQLGFADAAAFSRAFRRWTGAAPGLWREDAQRAEGPAAVAAERHPPHRDLG
jgi:AraC-like DNA-binding protein